MVPSPFICFGHWLKRGQRRKTQVIDLGAYVAGGQLEVLKQAFLFDASQRFSQSFPPKCVVQYFGNCEEAEKAEKLLKALCLGNVPHTWTMLCMYRRCCDGCNLSLHSLVSYTLMFEFLSPESEVGVKFQDHLFAPQKPTFGIFAVCWSNQQGPILRGLTTGSRACSAPHKDGCVHQGAGVWSAEGWRIFTLNVILLGNYRNCSWRSLPWIEYILKLQELGSKVSLWIWNCTRKTKERDFTIIILYFLLRQVVFFLFHAFFFQLNLSILQRLESAAICTSFHLLGPGAQA